MKRSGVSMRARSELTGRRELIALLTIVLLLLSTAIALAHDTTVTSSQPAAGSTVKTSPAQVSATFDEELETKTSTMLVLDAGGRQVSEGNGKVDLNDAEHRTLLASLPATLPEGVYTVKWHAVLTDGDASEGEFEFAVQAQGTPLLPAVQAPAAETPQAPSAPPAAAATTAAVPAREQQAATLPASFPLGWVAGALLAVAAVIGVVVSRRGR